nr:MAG TPA: hypothetical protein [Caudoviricetes sp.]
MSKISISTDKYIQNSYKEVVIDGVDFKVKKPGAGHQLDAMSVFREVGNAQKMMNSAETDEEKLEATEMLSDAINKMEASFVELFDDGTEDREKSKELIHRVGIDKIQNLLNDIFPEG